MIGDKFTLFNYQNNSIFVFLRENGYLSFETGKYKKKRTKSHTAFIN